MKAFKSSKLSTRLCNLCGNEYILETYRMGRSKYCSSECRQRGNALFSKCKNGSTQRYRGKGKSYVKYLGRHIHRVMAEMKIGRPLARGEIVHHIDGNRRNNSPANLAVMTQSEHAKVHYDEMMLQRKIKAGF